MPTKRVLVTGSNGLIGSEAVCFFDKMGWEIFGIDNNMRKDFFGETGDTSWVLKQLKKQTKRYFHFDIDIRERDNILEFFKKYRFDLIIHCAAQPSHDLAARRVFDDFDINALGTINLLESFRISSPEAVFIHVSTNKVYGDAPNRIKVVELDTRWDYAEARYHAGIDENFPIDQSTHSLFGASKLAADIVAQEYGRYFGLRVGVFRCGCLTGTNHAAVELHGFLNYLVRVALSGRQYTIYGYKGKQVRDQIHSYDVVNLFYEFYKSPKCGEVYNLGGGRENSVSILECIALIENISGKSINWVYSDANRIGDHICYISNLDKIKRQFPMWKLNYTLVDMISEMLSKIPELSEKV